MTRLSAHCLAPNSLRFLYEALQQPHIEWFIPHFLWLLAKCLAMVHRSEDNLFAVVASFGPVTQRCPMDLYTTREICLKDSGFVYISLPPVLYLGFFSLCSIKFNGSSCSHISLLHIVADYSQPVASWLRPNSKTTTWWHEGLWFVLEFGLN